MKQNYLILYFVFGLSALLNSQNYTGNWNVSSLESNGNIINLPSTVLTSPNINFDNFFSSPPEDYYQYDGSYINGNGICNSFTTYFEQNTDSISLIPYFETSENSCTTTEETDFENLFFSILQEQGNLSYSFSNDLHNLSITNSLGEVINLGRENATSNLLSGEWFVYSIFDYDILLDNTFDPNLSITFLDESVNGQSNFFGSSTCNEFSGSYDNPIQTSSFIKRSINWTLVDCNTADETNFEQGYMLFFEQLVEDIYTFEITGSGSDATLVIYNGYGSDITYGRQPLSIDNFEKSKTKILTNLSENKLQIISDTVLINSSYAIYDVSGRLISSNHINESKSITTNNLASGIYLLNIENSKNQTESFKVLKK